MLQSLFENSFYRKDNPEHAVTYLKQALAVLIDNHEPMRMYGCLLQLGSHYYEQGDYTQALSYYQRAAEGFEEAMHLQNLAIANSSIGLCYYMQGKLQEAEKQLLKALTLCQKAATPDNTAHCNYNLARVYVAQKNWLNALQRARVSQAVFMETNNQALLNDVNQLLVTIGKHLQAA